MSTISQGDLHDYYTNASGAALGYNSARVKGLSVVVKGQFTYRMAGNDLSEPDNETGKSSRYELQLYDVEHPHNRNDLDRLEELYFDYLTNWGYFKLGKMDITSPLVNPQDGRMKPYVVHGFWGRVKLIDNHVVLSMGAFNRFSPRGTTHWYDADHSIGIFGNGFATNGQRAHYHEKLTSKGLLLGGLNYHNTHLRVQLWDYYIDNISNTLYSQLNYHTKLVGSRQIRLGLQGLTQSQVGAGGNNDSIQFQYHTENDQVALLSSRIAFANKRSTFSINALKAFGSGRFLFPREWGREQFFVTVPRGRVEGIGDMSVIMLKSHFESGNTSIDGLDFSLGYFNLPGHQEYSVNKYELLSHYQFTANLDFSFHHILEGTTLRVLYINKFMSNYDEFRPELWYNKSHFQQLNVVLNILF